MPHITFIHGISNKPAADRLLSAWENALARESGLDCGTEGITTEMVYWADVLYTQPDTNISAYESLEELEGVAGVEQALAEEPGWREQLPPDERRLVERLAERLGADVASPEEGGVAPGAHPPVSSTEKEALETLERIPLPWAIKRPLMKLLLRDVHHYLFNVRHEPRPGESYQVRDVIRDRMLAALKRGAAQPGPHVVVSHSMGTVIAYDCLKRVPGCPTVDAFVTLGSPLGLDEIQDQFQPEWTRNDGFPHGQVRGRWVNVFDRLDPVAGFDPEFANDYRHGGRPVVLDIDEPNWGSWRHSITKYLRGEKLRQQMRELLQLA
jgi:hypothetical protein